MRNDTSRYTSGLAWNLQGSAKVTPNIALTAVEHPEGHQRGEIDGHRQQQSGIEQPTEDSVVESEVHEERHDREELDDHEDEEGRHEQLADAEVVQPDLRRGDDDEGNEDLDVEAVGLVYVHIIRTAMAGRRIIVGVRGVIDGGHRAYLTLGSGRRG